MQKNNLSKNELLNTIDKFKTLNILVVGDLILDRYIWGRVERISPEAPVPVVEVKSIEERLGGAGNVVRNLCNLGVKVTVCGYVGDDEEGAGILKLLRDCNVDKDGVVIDRQHPTTLKTRVIAHPQQIVRIDREDTSERSIPLQHAFSSLVESHLTNYDIDAIIVSDYAKGAISKIILEKLTSLTIEGKIDRNSLPLVIDPHPRNFKFYKNITIAKPNRKEAEFATGIQITNHQTALQAAHKLMDLWQSQMMMITLGEGGMVIASQDSSLDVCLQTVARQVFDVSGAGDTVTSVFTSALAVGASNLVAGQLANIAAGYVVSEVGTVSIETNRLISEVERLS